MFERKSFKNHYEGAMEPFRIIGNVYFVGTFPASSHLIDTDDGLILIDTGYGDTLHLLINSIYKLGFSPYDVKYIIHTHWHGDHTEATAAFCHLTGAKTFIGEKDFEKVKKHFIADEVLKDGDIVELGNTQIEIMETPGHTEGCISLFFETEENGVRYKVGTFGGAGVNTLTKPWFDYDNCREDYVKSLDKLRKRDVDVFIGNHVWNNDTLRKWETMQNTGENKFIDKTLWNDFLDFCENRLKEVMSREGQ